MSAWILVLIMTFGGGTSAVALTIDFPDQKSCQNGAAKLTEQMEGRLRTAVCIPKSYSGREER